MMVVTMFLFCSIYAQDETTEETEVCAISDGVISYDEANGAITIGSGLEISGCLLKISAADVYKTLYITSNVTIKD